MKRFDRILTEFTATTPALKAELKRQNKQRGGKQAAEKNLAKDSRFYSKIGAKGGNATKTKPTGFAARPELASEAGKKGAAKSRKKRHEPLAN